jgi:predicted metal-dependent hydrolase
MRGIEYTLKRSQRKTAVIHIRSGAVEVKAPLKMAKRDIDRFVESKRDWITQKLAFCIEQEENRNAFILDYGSPILLRGTERPIVIREGNSAGYDGETFYMPPGLASDAIKRVIIQLYKKIARGHLNERVSVLAGRMGVRPLRYPEIIRINSAKTRWGSCSSMNSINFSWRLIMADDAVIDYVVIHELAHLYELNHSSRFWAIVQRVLPNYKEYREALKILQKRIGSENWD